MTDRPYSQLHPALQFLIFIALTMVIIFVGYFIGSAVIAWLYGSKTLTDIATLNIHTPEGVRSLWILQVISTTLPLIIAPVFFAWVIVREPAEYLRYNVHFSPVLLLLVFFIMLMSMPIIEVLSELNQRLILPHSLKGLQDWMKASEQAAEKETNIILKMDNLADLFKVLLLVAATTAVVEETMFRGVLQTIFTRWTQNPHTSILITATLFSAFHMEFYGFLPRLMLGILFGYFVYWSGSIWTSVWAHFLNNGVAVVATYLYQHKIVKINPDDQNNFSYAGYVFSIIITVFLLINYYYTSNRESRPQT